MNDADAQIAETSKAIAINMVAMLAECGSERENGSRGMTDSELHRLSRVNRDAIRWLRQGKNEQGKAANCDLHTLCRIAAAIGVPPALLLMSKDDWQALLAAIEGLQSTAIDTRLEEQLRVARGTQKVDIGLQIAFQVRSRPERVPEDTPPQSLLREQRAVDGRNQARERRVRAATAMAQAAVRYPKNELLAYTTIGALLGDAHKIFK